MTTATITTRSTHTLRLSDFPAIWRMRRVLTDHLTRIWPTRRKAITPPAMAGLSTVAALDSELLDVLGSPQSKVITVFVPAEFREHLETIGAKCPRIRVQPDTGMTSQGAYVSWETGHGQPPLTLWGEAGVVLDALEANPMRGAQNVLPLLLVAGDTVLVSELAPDEDWRAQARAAIEAARVAPSGLSALALQKAATTAEKYSERPWLFMRYELKNGNERLAVNWAPVQRMSAAQA